MIAFASTHTTRSCPSCGCGSCRDCKTERIIYVPVPTLPQMNRSERRCYIATGKLPKRFDARK